VLQGALAVWDGGPHMSCLFPCTTLFRSDDEYLRLDRYRTELQVVEGSRWSTRPMSELQKAQGDKFRLLGWVRDGRPREDLTDKRSEEHTSELQSREKLVCRLLLEKKNKT